MTVEEEAKQIKLHITLTIMVKLPSKTITKSTKPLSMLIIVLTKLSTTNNKQLCGKGRLHNHLIILLIRRTQGTIKVRLYYNFIKL